jgi:hypothetical protein
MTTKFCPYCNKSLETKAIPFDTTDYAKSSKRNWRNEELKNIMTLDFRFCYFMRRLKCLTCNNTWITYEMRDHYVNSMKKKILDLTDLIEKNNMSHKSAVVFYINQKDELKKQLAEKDEEIKKLKTKLTTINAVSKLLEEI